MGGSLFDGHLHQVKALKLYSWVCVQTHSSSQAYISLCAEGPEKLFSLELRRGSTAVRHLPVSGITATRPSVKPLELKLSPFFP